MSLTIDGNANSITSSTAGVNIPATVDTLSVGPSGSYMIANSSGVGIGTLTPQEKVHISNSVSTNYIRLDNPSGRAYYGLNSSGDTEVNAATNNNLIFKTFGTERARIDSAGRMTRPYQPAFRAYYSSRTTTVGSGTFVFDQVDNNIGSHYSTSTGRFTAPISGYYHISCCIQHSGGTSTAGYVDIRKNGGLLYVRNEHAFGAVFSSIGTSVTVYLAAGDYVEIIGSAAVFWSDNSSFSGHFLG